MIVFKFYSNNKCKLKRQNSTKVFYLFPFYFLIFRQLVRPNNGWQPGKPLRCLVSFQ